MCIVMLSQSYTMAQFQSIGPVGSSSYNHLTKPESQGGGLGQIHCIAFAPQYSTVGSSNNYQTAYSGSPSSGLWKTTNGGQSWVSLASVQSLPNSSVNDIVVTNSPNYTIYITTGGTNYGWGGLPHIYSCGLYKSTDFGASFQPVNALNNLGFNINGGKYMTKVAVSPFNSNLIMVATSDGLYRSTDGGTSWTLVLTHGANSTSNHRGIFSVEFSPSEPNKVYCSGKEIFISTNQGATFTQLLNISPVISPKTFDVCKTVNGIWCQMTAQGTILNHENINIRVYQDYSAWPIQDVVFAHCLSKYSVSYQCNGATITESDEHNVLKINPQTATATLMTPQGSSFYSQTFYCFGRAGDRIKMAANPLDLNRFITGVTETKYTTNTGTSWQQSTGYNNNGHADIHAVEFVPDGTGNNFWIGTDGGIFQYNTSTGIVTGLNNGFVTNLVWQLSTSRTKKDHVAIGKQDCNGDWWDGTQWNQVGQGGDGYCPVHWDQKDENHFFISLNGSMHKVNSTNGTVNNIAGSTGCFSGGEFSGTITQNPNPSQADEFVALGKTHKAAVAVSNQPFAHLTDFKIMDTVGKPSWGAGFKKLYMSKSDVRKVYGIQWSFGHPQWYDESIIVFDRKDNYNTAANTSCATTANRYDPALTRYRQLFFMPSNYYEYPGNPPTEPCSLVVNNCNNPSDLVAKARIYNATDIAVSSIDANKIWVSIDYNRMYKAKQPAHVAHRLRKSTDGGITWADDHNGLPEEPVSHVTFLDGSNDGLFCATYSGRVFYKDATMSSWSELDVNLPRCPVTTLQVNYCTRMLYISTFGRGVWRYDLRNGLPASKEYTINGTVNWNNQQLDIGSNIVIKKGATLNITAGSIINMCRDCKITIEAGDAAQSGGILKVDGSTISNLCGEYWQGIEVMGDITKNQVKSDDISNATHCFNGRVYINNQALIENMKEGITNFRLTAPNNPGGQILTVNATFINNRYGIRLWLLDNTNTGPSTTTSAKGFYQSKVVTSYFVNRNRTDFQSHIHLNNIKGFQLFGSTLVDSANEATNDKGLGILAYNSIIEVLPFTNPNFTQNKNYFKGHTYGIYLNGTHAGTTSGINTKISRATFLDNTYGIYLNAHNHAIIVEDSFKVLLASDPIIFGQPNPHNKSYGIYLTGCSNYKVEDNQLYTTKALTSLNQVGMPHPYGVLVSNGHANNSLIRRNTFTKLRYAAVADGFNGTAGTNNGLLFQCNTFRHCEKYDLWLTGYQFTFGGTTYTINGILPHQGSTSLASFASHNTFQQFSTAIPQFQLIRNQFSSTYTYFWNPIYGLQFSPTRVSNTYPISVNNQGVLGVTCPSNVQAVDYQPSTSKAIVDEIVKQLRIVDEEKLIDLAFLKSIPNLNQITDRFDNADYISKEVLCAIATRLSNLDEYDAIINLLKKHAGTDTELEEVIRANNIAIKASDIEFFKDNVENIPSSFALKTTPLLLTLASEEQQLVNYYEDLVSNNKQAEAFETVKQFLDIENVALFYAIEKLESGVEEYKHDGLNVLRKSKNPLFGRLATFYEASGKMDTQAIKKIIDKADLATFKSIAFLLANSQSLYHPYLPDEESEVKSQDSEDKWSKIKLLPTFILTANPIPADKNLLVSVDNKDGQLFNLEILDYSGKLLLEKQKISERIYNWEINTSTFSSGSFFVKLISQLTKESHEVKFIVNHK